MLQTFYNRLIERNILSAAFPARCFYGVTIALSIVYCVLWGEGIVHNLGLAKPTKDIVCDFKAFYTAGQLAAEGTPALAYNYTVHAQKQRDLVEPTATYPFIQFPYPPYFLVISEFFAKLRYVDALLLWQCGSFMLAALAIYRILPRRETLLATLSFPAILANLAHGQTGFLTTAFLSAYLLLLEKRPALAGFFIGLLIYKPQFGVLIPIALIAGGYWRTIVVAVLTIAIMTLGVTLLYGLDAWTAFYHSFLLQKTVLERANEQLEIFHSAFAFVHKMGGATWLCYSVQGVVQVGVAGAIIWLWRKKNPADYALKAAALAVGSLLVTPYILDYELFALLPALVFIARHQLQRGFTPYAKLILSILWLTPAVARQLNEAIAVPVGFIALLGAFVFIIYLAVREKNARAWELLIAKA